MRKIYVILLVFCFATLSSFGEEKNPHQKWLEVEYTKQYRNILTKGTLDLNDAKIPKNIRNNKRATMYYRAGYIRGLLTRVYMNGPQTYDGLGMIHNLKVGMEHYEYDGYIAGCLVAHAQRSQIRMELYREVDRRIRAAP